MTSTAATAKGSSRRSKPAKQGAQSKTRGPKRHTAESIWGDEVLDLPRPGGPAERAVQRKTRRLRVFVWASVCLLPLALLGDVALVGSRATSKTASTTSAGASAGETAARLEIARWASQHPSPLPGARIVDWLGTTPVPLSKPGKQSPVAGGTVFRAEIDRFAVTGASGKLFDVSVEVALGSHGSAVPVGDPSIEPGPPSIASPSSDGPWPGINATATVSSTVAQAIQGWAQAYTSGSPSALHLAVGDPSSADFYQPLSGVASVTATPTWAAPVGSKSSDAEIVEVDLAITWSSQTSATSGVSGTSGTTGVSGLSGSSGSSSLTPMTMDVLVERASSAAPVVVAWGPPGSGPTLTPYANAIHR